MRSYQEGVQGETPAASWAAEGGGLNLHGDQVVKHVCGQETKGQQVAELVLRAQHRAIKDLFEQLVPHQFHEKGGQYGEHVGAAIERIEDRQKRDTAKGPCTVYTLLADAQGCQQIIQV